MPDLSDDVGIARRSATNGRMQKKGNAICLIGCMQKEGTWQFDWRCATNGRMQKKQDGKKHIHMMSKQAYDR